MDKIKALWFTVEYIWESEFRRWEKDGGLFSDLPIIVH
jgi:hypothetical protein